MSLMLIYSILLLSIAERQWSDPQCQISHWQRNQSWHLDRLPAALWRHPHRWVLRCHRGKHRLCELRGQSWGNWTGPRNTEGEKARLRGCRRSLSHIAAHLCLIFALCFLYCQLESPAICPDQIWHREGRASEGLQRLLCRSANR